MTSVWDTRFGATQSRATNDGTMPEGRRPPRAPPHVIETQHTEGHQLGLGTEGHQIGLAGGQ